MGANSEMLAETLVCEETAHGADVSMLTRPPRTIRRCALRRLDPAVSDDRVTMCAVIDRIPAFLARVQSDNPPLYVQRYIHSHWTAGHQAVAVWAATSPLGRVVGHVIAMIELSWGIPYAMLTQTELDSPYLTTAAQRRVLFAEMEAWAASQGATKIKTLTPRNPDVYPRHNGFHVEKVLMVREVASS